MYFLFGIDSALELFASPSQTAPTTATTTPTVAKMKTQWKDIPAVPTSQEFLDIVLSRTQRR